MNKLADERQTTRAWAIGAAGEEKLASVLAAIEGIQVLHDRRLPGRRANIDHIVFAPAGVFVVDTKHYKGMVRIRRRGPFFRPEPRLYVGSRDRTPDVQGVRDQVAIVEGEMGSIDLHPRPTVTPVLCFTQAEWPLFGVASTFDGVHLTSDRSIGKLLVGSNEYSHDEMLRLRAALAKRLPER